MTPLLRPRPHLHDAALNSPAEAFLLVAGPGGGKSVAARLLAQAWGLPLLWWPAAELAEALGGDGPAPEGSGGAEAWAAQAEALAQSRREALLAQHPEGACVVVDAVEAGGPAALAFLRAWLAEAPPGRLVMTSRRPVPLPWAQRLAEGRLRVLGPKDLWVGPAELAALAPPGAEGPGPLLRGMGGWPLGSFALLRQPDADEAFAEKLVGEAWLDALPPSLARALGPLSLWPELDDGVLNALGLAYVAPWALGEPEPEATLPFLKRWGLVQDDAVGRLVWVPWVRLALQRRWRAEASLEAQAQAEGLAGAWLKEHDPLAAVRGLLAQGAVGEAVALLRPWGDRLAGAGDWAGLATLLNALPLPFRLSQPAILLLEGQLLAAQGEAAEAAARCEAAAALFGIEGDEAGAQDAAAALLRLQQGR